MNCLARIFVRGLPCRKFAAKTIAFQSPAAAAARNFPESRSAC
jgi:hypothetical protein